MLIDAILGQALAARTAILHPSDRIETVERALRGLLPPQGFAEQNLKVFPPPKNVAPSSGSNFSATQMIAAAGPALQGPAPNYEFQTAFFATLDNWMQTIGLPGMPI
jgi:hypothetical protein